MHISKSAIKAAVTYFKKMTPENSQFENKMSLYSATNGIPIIKLYELAQEHYNVDFSETLYNLREFYK